MMLGACVVVPALPVVPDFDDRNQRAAAGAVVGAGAGALIGSMSGDAGTGAVLGGAIGGVLGALTPPPKPDRAPEYDPREGGWYDRYGRWYAGPPPQANHRDYR
jgi:hypothetical protein